MAKDVLPDAARVLPPAGQVVWIKAFKEAKLKGMPEDEASAFAWAAVKRAGYHRLGDGKWGKMMNAELVFNGDELTIGVPFVKINAQKRIVAGFATLDNVDHAGDVLDADASKDAFAKWVGNIREMHERKAVGRAVNVMQKDYTDEDGTVYKGIWVEARVSKGAEDTWQKVLDGTLAGFSVGGAVHEKERSIVKLGDEEHEVWRVTKYSLNEVSLVDNPCNGLALVSLIKSVDGKLAFEDVLDEDGIEEELVKGHSEDSDQCCMGEIDSVLDSLKAWRQRAIDDEKDNEVANISNIMSHVRSYKRMEEYEHEDQERMEAQMGKSNTESEGEPMTKADEDTQELHNNDISGISNVDDLTPEHRSMLRKMLDFILGEKVAEADEEATETDELEKKGDVTSEMNEEEVKTLIEGATEGLTKSADLNGKFEEIGAALSKVAETLDSVAKADALNELKSELEGKVSELATRIEALETTGAVKKSGDVDSNGSESLEKEDKGLWSDSIVPEFLKKQVG